MMHRRRLFLSLIASTAAMAGGARASEKKAEGKEGDGNPFLELPTLTATAIRPGGRRGVLTVQATLRIPDAEKRLKATKLMPRLKDAYVSSLQTWAYQMVPGSLPNVTLMTQSLQKATDRVLGAGNGATVLLGGVMMV